jgi:7,8-dihydropterin-6-yl-methyl-4-(beta-D-ribofuranosyl)aminobenzene 5'-phosphate synthase
MRNALRTCVAALLVPLAVAAAEPPLALRPIAMPKPVLPDEVCRQRLNGWVEMDFAVLPDGTVAEVKVVKSEPAGAFDAAATASVKARLYPPQPKPVKMHERLLMSAADCRADQLRAGPVLTPGATLPAEECAAIAAEARQSGERIDAAESGRAVLSGETAQVFSAPSEGCFTPGKALKPGGKWTAYVEYKGFSLIGGPKDKEDTAFWVWSKRLKDTAPILPVPGATAPPGTPAPPRGEPARVQALKITVLSTMLAERAALGEWGFAALVEVDGRRILFDTGNRPDTVLQNAASLGIDLAGVEDVVLSHSHADHTGGLVKLRQELMKKNPNALLRAHVLPQIFWPRIALDAGHVAPMGDTKQAYEAAGGKFVIHERAEELLPGVWLSGPVPRPFDEKNYPPGIAVQNPAGERTEDNVPEDLSLVFNTADGLVILSGCGHAGVVNTVDHARHIVRPAKTAALIGGFHLFTAPDAQVQWTATKLEQFGVGSLLGAHCTGIEAVYELRKRMKLTRATAIVGAVGSTYTLGSGVDAGGLGLAK